MIVRLIFIIIIIMIVYKAVSVFKSNFKKDCFYFLTLLFNVFMASTCINT